MKRSAGFTLPELMVVLAIMGILASIAVVGTLQSGQRARDVDRQADLKTVQAAIELYKQRYGRYPEGCKGADPFTGQYVFSGQDGTNFACPAGKQYIVGLAPEFIPALPNEKKLPDANSGYVYSVNSEGSVYKFEARRTVESEVVTYSHKFKSCDVDNTSRTTRTDYSNAPLCNALMTNGSKPTHCDESNSTFRTSYAVWGGNANGSGVTVGSSADNTEDIVCL